MKAQGEYLGMPLSISEADIENAEYFAYCAKHDFRLQACTQCKRLRYPPATACPWCAALTSTWEAVPGHGTVHSYVEVHQPIQPAFKAHVPYTILLVDLDTQRGEPTEHEALRVIGNLVDAAGRLAGKDIIERVGIGSRVRMVFSDVSERIALPQWALDETEPRPLAWRYPG